MGKCHLCQLFDADHDTKSCPWLICKHCGKSSHAVKFCPKLKFQPLNESVISKNSSHLQKCHEVFSETNSEIESDPKNSKNVNFAKEPFEQPKDITQNQESVQNYEKTHWNLLDMIKE